MIHFFSSVAEIRLCDLARESKLFQVRWNILSGIQHAVIRRTDKEYPGRITNVHETGVFECDDITTLGAVADISECELTSLPRFGEISMLNARKALKKIGITLRFSRT